MLSFTEENYLKAVLMLTINNDIESEAGTNRIAASLNVKPATASDMLKKLREKNLVVYEKYNKITLTDNGRTSAVEIVRKHRLWETFLYKKLGFSWDEVHEVAEQLEHIQSQKLINRLDEFLGFPIVDPHGDVIPKANGEIEVKKYSALSKIKPGTGCTITGVKDSSPAFLKYVTELGLKIEDQLHVSSRQEFDGSMEITIGKKALTVSQKFADNILVDIINQHSTV